MGSEQRNAKRHLREAADAVERHGADVALTAAVHRLTERQLRSELARRAAEKGAKS